MAFIDEAKFFIKAGSGGHGCVSFRREKFVPKGGPDGGDGGDGGDVVIEATSRQTSLIDFQYRSHFLAKNGVHGQGKKMHGRRGQGHILHVPVGSVIKNAETGEVLADLVRDGDRFVAARGGRGGRGNVHFASSRNRTPRTAENGQPGEEFWLRIELKLLADVGLVGLPNAGKSTLLSRLSAAQPKIASYPFTTLEPHLGVLRFDDTMGGPRSCIIADIPGLIEGAHQGAGLGHKFLRHIERTSVLLHVIDASEEGGRPVRDFQVLEEELRCYNVELLGRQRLVLLNKMDLVDEARLAELRDAFYKIQVEPIVISAATREGLDVLQEKLAGMLSAVKKAAEEQEAPDKHNDIPD